MVSNTARKNVRYHLLKVLEGALDFGARRNIVFDLVDERRVGDASRVGGRIFTNNRSIVSLVKECISYLLPSFDAVAIIMLICCLERRMEVRLSISSEHVTLSVLGRFADKAELD